LKTFHKLSSFLSLTPADLFGGTWDAMPAGRVLLAQGKSQWGTTYAAGSTGGEATHLLTPEEMPRHKHDAVATTTPLTGTYTADRWGSGPGTATGVFSAGTGSGSNCRLDNVASPVKINLNATHLHEITINSEGGDKPHPNMQPYLAVFIWVRTA
jgi:microcystin-dependent protein